MIAESKETINKSYVHLPGTGSDNRAGRTFLDLALGSNLAACIHVPQQEENPRDLMQKLATSKAALP